VRSITLQAALEQAYANTISSGRFPSCCLYIKTKFCDVDVNVHPAKTEVKFFSDRQVFNAVYFAAKSALDYRAAPPARSDLGSLNCVGTHAFEQPKSDDNGGVNVSGNVNGSGNGNVNGNVNGNGSGNGSGNINYGLNHSGIAAPSPPVNECEAREPSGHGSNGGFVSPGELGDSFRRVVDDSFHRVVGEALRTYIIVECMDSVWFIDKHAAHERIHFDAMKSDSFIPMSQTLIAPVVCRQGHEDASLLLESTEFLDGLGFSVESFGDDAVAVRRIPADINICDTEPVLSGICAQLRHRDAADSLRRDNILRVIACKAALKAGKSSVSQELEALASKVMSGEVTHCPHGRPIAFELSKATLDRGFKRT